VTAASTVSNTGIGEVTVRSATRDDLRAVTALLSDNRLPLEGVPDSLANFFVAESRGSIVGVIGMELYDRYALLRSAAVAKSEQNNGVGRVLVDRLLADAVKKGVAALYLLTTTAEKYFSRIGFARVERSEVPVELLASEEFRGACPDSAVIMRLLIGHKT
jgi:amino-acid N-acetyltransferase